MKIIFQFAFSVLLIVMNISVVQAGISLNQTRLVIEQKESQGNIIARNSDDFPYLIASYMTKGVRESTPLKDIFIITPGVFRLDGDSQNMIKVRLVNSQLPKDRESIFYLHVRTIPAANKGETGIQVGMEHVIKVFYRPNGLPMSSQTAYGKLTVQPTNEGVKITNPTPYYISLNSIKLNNKNIPVSIKLNNNLIAPFGYIDFITPERKGEFSWSVINELGGVNAFSQPY